MKWGLIGILVASSVVAGESVRYPSKLATDIQQVELDRQSAVVRTVDKPAVVIAAEQSYVQIYQMFYGPGATSYTNASLPAVQLYVLQACQADPNLYVLTFPFSESFKTIEYWWSAVRFNSDAFHPYPWGLDTGIKVQGDKWVQP